MNCNKFMRAFTERPATTFSENNTTIAIRYSALATFI